MLLLIPTKNQLDLARHKTDRMERECLDKYGTPHPPNSMKKGAGTFQSLVAEVVLADFYGFDFSAAEDRHDYDLHRPDYFGRVDNKTKIRTVPPQPDYLGSVASFNTRQRCDFYCFTSILQDSSKLWVAGFYPKALFYVKGFFANKGDLDPTSRHGWTFKEDCWNLAYGDMWAPPEPDSIDGRFRVEESFAA